MTRDELLALPARIDLVPACAELGIGRTNAYARAKAGDLPFPVLRVGHKYVVPTAGLLRALGIEPAATA